MTPATRLPDISQDNDDAKPISDIHKIDRFFSSENVHGLNSEQWLMSDRKMESQM